MIVLLGKFLGELTGVAVKAIAHLKVAS